MKTYLVTMVVSFDILCNDDDTLADKGYAELGYNAESYANLVKEELENRWTFDVGKPIVKKIAED